MNRKPFSLFPLLAASVLAFFCVLSLSSCLTLADSMDLLTSQAVSQGLLDNYQATMLKVAAKAATEVTRRLSPEEEYFVGRAVAASIFSTYRPYDCFELNAYLNKLGQGLALYSPRPEIYAGYRFIVLDSGEINAFASPGGHILVTRGLLRKVQSEDELAAVLAHEIAHISLGHGLASVQGARITQIASEFAISAGHASGGDIAAFTSAFGDSISELAKTIVISGYSQTYEFQADIEARNIIVAAGYDPNALSRLIGHLPRREGGNAAGFAVTHPEPLSRQEALRDSPLEPGKAAAAKRAWPVPREENESMRAVNLVRASFVRAERFETLRGFF